MEDNGNNNNTVQIEGSSNTVIPTSALSTSTSTSTSTSSTLTTLTSFGSNTSQQQEYNQNRNKNKKYNDQNKNYNNNNKYRKGNNNKYNNRSQYNNSQQHRQHQQQYNHSQYDNSQQHRQHRQHQQQYNRSQYDNPQRHKQQQKNYYQSKKKDPSFKPKEFEFNKPYKLIDFVGGINYTPSQDDGLIFNRVVEFFKNIITTVEEENKLLDYNFYLKENEGLHVKILQSNPRRYPPRKTLNCLSCDTESETNKNSKLPYPSSTREEVSIHHNLWMDAKARSMFIITPKRHVERLSECNDQEIYSMFLLATQIIEQETRLSNAKWNGIRFVKMTLNHGNARNVEHLHLKIRIDDKDFSRFKSCWDKERKKNFGKLKNGLYKRDERLAKIS